METRMTKLLGIKHPIMLAGMGFVADDPKLVAAISNAGALGLLATSTLTPDGTRVAVRQIRELTDKPFGANVTLLFDYARENAEVVVEEKVPVVNWSLGNADWLIRGVHAYGGKVLGTVVKAKHALRAEQDGADALIVTGYEAGGHGGDVTSLVLIPVIASKVKVPVIAAGGFADGRGLAAALALGAEGISMGTRFAITKESPIHQSTLELCLKTTEEDTIYYRGSDGLGGRHVRTKTAEMLAQDKVPLHKAFHSAMEAKRLLKIPMWRLIIDGMKNRSVQGLAHQAVGLDALRKSVVNGDNVAGIMTVGQAIGLINDVPTCKELIDHVMSEAEAIIAAMQQKAAARA